MNHHNNAKEFIFPSAPKDEFHAHVHKLRNLPNDDISSFPSQMAVLHQICSSDDFLKTIYTPTPAQQKKDRYLNVHPSIEYRVRLKPINNDSETDYINGCWFQSTLPGAKTKYIATQAPVPASFFDFWRMVWDHDVRIILMLTSFVENDKVKADKYWSDELKEVIKFGDISVSTTSVFHTLPTITLREFKVTRGDVTRQIHHIQYTGWPDHGVPDLHKYDEIVTLLRLYRERRATVPNCPVVFHCSAGIGRNGTFQTIDTILDNLASANPVPINVFNAVLELRMARPGSIQTPQQYEFVYRFIDHCLENGLFGASKEKPHTV